MVEKTAEQKVSGSLASRVAVLEGRVGVLEELAGQLSKKASRRKWEYTEEQRKAIRARLLAGQEAARRRREDEAKAAKKAKAGNVEKARTGEGGKLEPA